MTWGLYLLDKPASWWDFGDVWKTGVSALLSDPVLMTSAQPAETFHLRWWGHRLTRSPEMTLLIAVIRTPPIVLSDIWGALINWTLARPWKASWSSVLVRNIDRLSPTMQHVRCFCEKQGCLFHIIQQFKKRKSVPEMAKSQSLFTSYLADGKQQGGVRWPLEQWGGGGKGPAQGPNSNITLLTLEFNLATF